MATVTATKWSHAKGCWGHSRGGAGRPSSVALVQKFVVHQKMEGRGLGLALWCDSQLWLTTILVGTQGCRGQGQVEHDFPFAS